MNLTLNELCARVDLPIRTVRYYVQISLLDRPQGETRAARYTERHLQQLEQIKKWSNAGLSLERMRELLHADSHAQVPLKSIGPGSVEVKPHVYVADGLELVIDPARAGLSAAMLRELIAGITELYAGVTAMQDSPAPGASPISPIASIPQSAQPLADSPDNDHIRDHLRHHSGDLTSDDESS